MFTCLGSRLQERKGMKKEKEESRFHIPGPWYNKQKKRKRKGKQEQEKRNMRKGKEDLRVSEFQCNKKRGKERKE